MIIRIPCSVKMTERLLNFSNNDIDEDCPSIRMEIVHDKTNPKGTSFSKEALEDAKETLYDKPILAYIKYDENGEPIDFSEHDITVVSKVIDGKVKYELKYIEQPIGTFSRNFDINFEKNEENGKEYLVATGTIWKRYCKDAYELLQDSDKSISMEIDIIESEKDKDTGVLNIEKFKFLGVTMLGDEYLPGIDGANATINFSKVSNEEELLKFFNGNKQNEKGENQQMEGKKGNYSLSLDAILNEVNKQLSERLVEKQYSWGEKYMAREFYFRDIIPQDNIVIVESDRYTTYGLPYTMNGDVPTLDFDNKKEYVYEWREKNMNDSMSFSLDEVKEMTLYGEIDRVNEVANTIIQKANEDLNQVNEDLNKANTTIFAKDTEIEDLKQENISLKGEIDTYKLEKEQKEKEQYEKDVEDAIAKFSFADDEVSNMKEQCLNREFDIETLNCKLFALYGKKAYEAMEQKKNEQEPQDGIGIGAQAQEPKKHIPYNGIFED